eukprot:TRINITY_DN6340_c0_g1_i1.p4 TRINITY_DN6340_c0_g1~~TRINITY_DN6340_c0_g1_i1.p4  ORF type:complete len:102 (-),score=11.93 TRINITY_DN6340_c0_g1_i1:299-604(-)
MGPLVVPGLGDDEDEDGAVRPRSGQSALANVVGLPQECYGLPPKRLPNFPELAAWAPLLFTLCFHEEHCTILAIPNLVEVCKAQVDWTQSGTPVLSPPLGG